MSSASKWNVGGVSKAIREGAMSSGVQEGQAGPSNHLSQRQSELDHYWRFFRCSTYDGRMFDWNGHQDVGHIEHDHIATSGIIPPGMYDAANTVPLKFRRPSAPYYLAKVIVNRFTSLLFSSKRHPKIEADDPDTEDWLNGFAESTRLWANMIRARTYGGAMGSVGMGFKFVKGKPMVEVHDPRWCMPEFVDRDLLTVKRMEKLYQYMAPRRDPETGEWVDAWFWYRRVIDDKRDVVWPKVPVEKNETPNWTREHSIAVDHNFGFCPVVWIQNQQVDDDIDGDPDCHGIFELIERIDGLYSQADRGTVANCDPSVIIASDSERDHTRKGSGTAIQIEKGGSVDYMEMNGSGIKQAVELADILEEKALTIARVMLDRNKGGPSRTVQEVEHNYSSMIEQCDIFREQYGEKGVKQLLEMVVKAAKILGVPRVGTDDNGVAAIRVAAITLPKRKVINEETGETVGWVERKLGKGEQLAMRWPEYFTPSAEHVARAVEAAGKAKDYNLIDLEHAVSFVAEYFGVENKAEMMKNIEAQVKSGQLLDPAEAAASRSTMGGSWGKR